MTRPVYERSLRQKSVGHDRREDLALQRETVIDRDLLLRV